MRVSRQAGSVKRSCGRASLLGEVAVGLVEDEGGAVVAGDGGELGDERGRVFGAGGVVGGDEHDGAGAGGEAGAGGGGVGEHAGAAGERDGLDAGHVEPHLVVEVPRHRQQDGVAGGGEGHHGGAEGLVAAGGDGHLLGADLAAVERRRSARRSRSGARGGRGPGRRGGCRARRIISAMAARRSSGGGSTGAAWLRLRSGRRSGKSTPWSQRRASITGGGAVARMSGLKGVIVRSGNRGSRGQAIRRRWRGGKSRAVVLEYSARRRYDAAIVRPPPGGAKFLQARAGRLVEGAKLDSADGGQPHCEGME